MASYQSRIGKPVEKVKPAPHDDRLFVDIGKIKHEQRQALWRAIQASKPLLAQVMTESNLLNDIRQAYGAKIMMERTEVEELLNTQGMTYEDF